MIKKKTKSLKPRSWEVTEGVDRAPHRAMFRAMGHTTESLVSRKKISRSTPITEGVLREITDRIVRDFHPLKVILFGSYAYGRQTPDSDVDLLVILGSRKRPVERRADISLKCRPPFVPLEIVALTPGEIRQRLADFDPFVEEILTKGRILYEAKRKE